MKWLIITFIFLCLIVWVACSYGRKQRAMLVRYAEPDSLSAKDKRPKFKSQGCIVALTGAFVWIYSFTPWTGWEAFGFSAYAVFVSGWFVIPIGLGLGHMLPLLVAGMPISHAFFSGILVGTVTAIVAAIFTKPLLGRISDYSHLPSMLLVCCAWVGVWSIRVARSADEAMSDKRRYL